MKLFKQISREFGKEPCAVPAPVTTSRATKTVLVAEADPRAREFAALVLSGLGYSVLEATDGSEVLAIIRDNHRRSVDLLLTDFLTPFTGGEEMAWQLWSVFPRQRALFCCAYPGRMARRLWRLDKEIAFLQKPYSAQALARKVQELLAA